MLFSLAWSRCVAHKKADNDNDAKRRREERKQAKEREKQLKALNPRKLTKTYVASLTTPGLREELSAAVDTVQALYRRRQLSERAWLAVEDYRRAYDTIAARLGGAMDFERVRGGGMAGYSDRELAASEKLNHAAKVLGMIDGRVVDLIVGQNRSLEEVARMICGPDEKTDRAGGRACNHIGRRLRESLELLADHWHRPRRQGIVSYRDPDAKPEGGKAGAREIEVNRVHATSSKIHRDGDA